MARVGEIRISVLDAFRTSVLGSIMNLLPLPGSVAVRVVRLRHEGVDGRKVGVLIGVTGLVSLAVAGLIAAGVLLGGAPGRALSLGSALLLSGVVLIIERKQSLGRGSLLGLLLVQFALIGLDATRLWLIGSALGLNLGVEASLILVLAPVLSTAIGFVPGGLGLREGIAALLATGIGVSVDAAIAVSAADTLVRVLGLVVCSPVLLVEGPTSSLDSEADLHRAAA
jgi:hypothetical protein